MSRRIQYHKDYLENLWADYQKSGKKLKEYCKTTLGEDGKPLNYISIYTALRKNGVMEYIKKNKTKTVTPTAPATV